MGGRWRVRGFGGDVWLVQRSAGFGEGGATLPAHAEKLTPAAAVGSLDGWFPEGWGNEDDETTLRSICLSLGDPPDEALSDAARSLRRTVKAALRDGRLVALRPSAPSPPGSSHAEEEEAPPQQAAPAAVKTWIKIKIVDDATGKPVPGVTLTLTLPDGRRTNATTGKDGILGVDGLDPGTCDATSSLAGAKVGSTLAFAGTADRLGSASAGAGDKGGGAAKSEDPIIPPGAYIVAKVERHKVKKGETLGGLASDHGSTWQELASFNWGTTHPEGVNRHLHDDVGCTKKTADGKNYVFDDTDKPGIVYLPSLWDEGGLATGKVHTFRVKRLALSWIEVRFTDEDDFPFKNVVYTLALADGGGDKRSGVTDDQGRGFQENVGTADRAAAFPDFKIDPPLEPARTHSGAIDFRALASAKLAPNKRWIVRYTENLTYVVHGTTPFGGNPATDCLWSQPNGRFSRELARVHPGVYRCGPVSVTWLNWGGANDHTARVNGGAALAASIQAMVARKKGGGAVFNKIDLVAHSHGGNVVLEALHLLADTDVKVNNVVLIATPQFRIRYKDQLFGSKKAPPDHWLYYHCDNNTKPKLVSAIAGKLFNVYSPEDTVQNYWADMSDGVSASQIPQTSDFRYELDAERFPPALAGAIGCRQGTNVGGKPAHSVLHSSLMGGAVGRLLEGMGWAAARQAAGVPDTITDKADQGD